MSVVGHGHFTHQGVGSLEPAPVVVPGGRPRPQLRVDAPDASLSPPEVVWLARRPRRVVHGRSVRPEPARDGLVRSGVIPVNIPL